MAMKQAAKVAGLLKTAACGDVGDRAAFPHQHFFGAGDTLAMNVDAPRAHAQSLLFVPYYCWANRGEGEMRVWMKQ